MDYYKLKILKTTSVFKKYVLTAISAVVAFIAPVGPLIIAVLGMVFLDLITAILGVYLHQGFKAIESKRMRLTVSKTLLYFLMIIVSHLLDTLFIIKLNTKVLDTLIVDFSYGVFHEFKITVMMSMLIIAIEAFSVDENIKRIIGKSVFEQAGQLFSIVRNKMSSLLKTKKNDNPE